MEDIEEQKLILENKIYSLLKQTLFEEKDNSKDNDGDSVKRQEVQKWLDSAQQLHSVLAYKLWKKEKSRKSQKAAARSLFSKKYRGHDNNGKPYSFTPSEITSLYNMKDSFIEQIS